MQHHHDHIYLLIATALAVFGSWTALDLFRRARLHDGTVQAQWVTLSAVAMGVSIWSMHFVAMLGFDPGSPVSYDLGLTLGSLALAMAGTAVAFTVCAQPGKSFTRLAGSGVIMGLSIGGMHYVGMAALRTSAVVGYWRAEYQARPIRLRMTITAAPSTATCKSAASRMAGGYA